MALTDKEEDLIEIVGQVEHIVYQNEDNGYTVCDLSDEKEELITAVGIMPFLSAGETIHAMGKWELHASFGRQFKVSYFEKQLPASASAILRYLSSRAVKGIGPKTAERLVERYGEETFDVIENHPDWLATVPGISEEKAKKISQSFKENFGVRSVMMFCRDFFGPATAVKVYKKWGGAAVDTIKNNPYALCEEIGGIGFESADRIARSLGVSKTDPERMKSGIKYFLSYNAQQSGHCYIPESKVIPAAAQMLQAEKEPIRDALEALIADGQLVRESLSGRDVIYLKAYHEAEAYTAEKLIKLDALCETVPLRDADRFITQLEEEFSIEYAPLQRKAIKCALTGGVMVLTGGPGTGKTTVIRALMTTFDRMGYQIALAAPTGRAAKRMSDATGREAKTIHRLLEMEFTEDNIPKFHRGSSDLLDEDVVIIDETSMVDIQLMAALLHAIKPGARLLLIGDSDQLPSVGAGLVLSDIIASGRFSTVELKDIFRQAGESLIVTNAHAINSGEYPDLTVKTKDFFFLPRENDSLTAKTIADLCCNRLPKKYGADIKKNIQVITPSHKGTAGTDCLNALLQSALNPPAPGKQEKKTRDIVFREGDRVMQTRNNYDLNWKKNDIEGIGVFNGDIGVIEAIHPQEETLTVRFDDERVAEYDFTLLEELEHAYAITIHKSQGSEYPVVIIPAYLYSPRLLTRNLLYTAVTRAQDMVILVGSAQVICGMVDNNHRDLRYTGLQARLALREEEGEEI